MTRPAFAIALVVVSALIGGGILLFAKVADLPKGGAAGSGPILEFPGEGVLRFRPGDRLSYEARTGTSTVRFDVEVLAPRLVGSPARLPVRGLPFFVSVEGAAASAPRDVYVSRLAEGGLALRLAVTAADSLAQIVRAWASPSRSLARGARQWARASRTAVAGVRARGKRGALRTRVAALSL